MRTIFGTTIKIGILLLTSPISVPIFFVITGAHIGFQLVDAFFHAYPVHAPERINRECRK